LKMHEAASCIHGTHQLSSQMKMRISIVLDIVAVEIYTRWSWYMKDITQVRNQAVLGGFCSGLSKEITLIIWNSECLLVLLTEVSQGQPFFLTYSRDFELGPGHLQGGTWSTTCWAAALQYFGKSPHWPECETNECFLFIGECYVESTMQGKLTITLAK
jgi:hypothetical protein